jgi:hypothetical protein
MRIAAIGPRQIPQPGDLKKGTLAATLNDVRKCERFHKILIASLLQGDLLLYRKIAPVRMLDWHIRWRGA